MPPKTIQSDKRVKVYPIAPATFHSMISEEDFVKYERNCGIWSVPYSRDNVLIVKECVVNDVIDVILKL